MEKEIINLDKVTLFHYRSQLENNKAIIIAPSSAGYYAQKKEHWGDAKKHIDYFCSCLSEKYHVFYALLPGQDLERNDLYSYQASVAAVKEAALYVGGARGKGDKFNLVGGIGMCTGGAILSNVFMSCVDFKNIPLVLYSTAAWVGWSIPKLQNKFTNKYPQVRLDRESLLSAPQPGNVIADHTGPVLQILVGSIDYPLGGKPGRGGQEELVGFNKNIETVLFKEMSDVPIRKSRQYWPMIRTVLRFFE